MTTLDPTLSVTVKGTEKRIYVQGTNTRKIEFTGIAPTSGEIAMNIKALNANTLLQVMAIEEEA